MQSLKEALLKTGLITKEKIKAAEEASKRRGRPNPPKKAVRPSTPRPPKPVEKVHEHHIRTLCEECQKSSPDVEYYQHRKRSLDKYWLCVKCADDQSVPDDCRQTHQSPQAKTGLFRREYGATKVFQP
ncbi:MAG: hypothetical protein HYS22_05895 [Deltaproteobacteria bacterium]|nr:hypothetical protein [Deltaproteobacteria bacterium]